MKLRAPATLIGVAFVLNLLSCGGDDPTAPESPTTLEISISVGGDTSRVDDVTKLMAEIVLEKGEVRTGRVSVDSIEGLSISFEGVAPGSVTYTVHLVDADEEILYAGAGSAELEDGQTTRVSASLEPAWATLTLLSPSGGDEFLPGDSASITWDSNAGGTIKIELLESGSLCEVLANSEPNDGSFDWVVEGCGESSAYKIQLTSNEDPTLTSRGTMFAIDDWPTSVETEQGLFYVVYEPVSGEVPFNERFSLKIQVYEGNDHAWFVTDAEIYVDATMPAHGHGMNTVPSVLSYGDGTFRVDGMLFHMRGEWRIDVTVVEGPDFDIAHFTVQM